MDFLLSITARFRGAFDLKPGELGDIYATFSLIASAVGFVLAMVHLALK